MTAPELRSTLDNLVRYNEMNFKEDNYSGDSGHDRDTDGEPDSEERKVKAQAKSNRKVRELISVAQSVFNTVPQIADLEITNRSLLAINASLETAKHRQAREIRDLRRKLRESRLILPPLTFRAVKSSLDHDDTAEEDDEEEDNDQPEIEVGVGDEVYKRIKVILEGLIETGKRALETTSMDFAEGGKGGAKVLSAEEVRTWRDSSGAMPETHPGLSSEDGIGVRIPPSPSHVAVPDSDDSEDEIEVMTLPRNSPPPSPAPPPILITESH